MQEKIKDEIMSVAKRRYPGTENMTFADTWRLKSDLVRGMRSTL